MSSDRPAKTPPSTKPFDSSLPLVLCHMDLTPFNNILDNHNSVWLIDWGCSGIYPQFFEFAGMKQVSSRYQLGTWLSRIVGGFYNRHVSFFASISWALDMEFSM